MKKEGCWCVCTCFCFLFIKTLRRWRAVPRGLFFYLSPGVFWLLYNIARAAMKYSYLWCRILNIWRGGDATATLGGAPSTYWVRWKSPSFCLFIKWRCSFCFRPRWPCYVGVDSLGRLGTMAGSAQRPLFRSLFGRCVGLLTHTVLGRLKLLEMGMLLQGSAARDPLL